MKKLSMLFAVVLLALPAFAGELQVFRSADLALRSVATDDCLYFASGVKALCRSQAGNSAVFTEGLIVEGRLSVNNGATILTGPGAGDAIYLGQSNDPAKVQESGFTVISENGMVIAGGNFAFVTRDGLARSYPVTTIEPNSLQFDEEIHETGDRGTTDVALPAAFRRISNLDPASRGRYSVLVLFLNGTSAGGNWMLVPSEDKFPDHYVVRSPSGKAEKFIASVRAIQEGAIVRPRLSPKQDDTEYAAKPLDPAQVLEEMREARGIWP